MAMPRVFGGMHGISSPDLLGLDLDPLHWEYGVLALKFSGSLLSTFLNALLGIALDAQ